MAQAPRDFGRGDAGRQGQRRRGASQVMEADAGQAASSRRSRQRSSARWLVRWTPPGPVSTGPLVAPIRRSASTVNVGRATMRRDRRDLGGPTVPSRPRASAPRMVTVPASRSTSDQSSAHSSPRRAPVPRASAIRASVRGSSAASSRTVQFTGGQPSPLDRLHPRAAGLRCDVARDPAVTLGIRQTDDQDPTHQRGGVRQHPVRDETV